jgi:type IV pilus assembly protein PilM
MAPLKERLQNIKLSKFFPKILREGKDIYGIDMGSKSIKIVRLNRKSKSDPWTLQRWAWLPFSGAGETSVIEKTPEAIQLIKDFLGKEKGGTRSVAISVSGNSVVVRYVKLPKTSKEHLTKMLALEAEPYIPFAIPEVDLGFDILGEVTEDGQPKMDTVLVAVKKEVLAQHLDIIRSCGLQPVVVDIDAFCLQRVAPMPPPSGAESNEAVMVLNIGASVTTMSILEQGVCRVARDVFIAGNAVDKALQKNPNFSPEEADKVKQSVSLSTLEGSEASKTIIAVLKDLILEIQRSLDFYLSQRAERQVQKIFLSGGCARLRGLNTFLSSELRLPVELLDPFAGIEGGENVPPELKPHMAIAVGLAMRREDDNK